MLKHKDLIDFTKNPFELFNNWYDLANETEVNDPNAMTLSTILNNQPSSRVVLLKSHSEEGFVFYTNSNSKKGIDFVARINNKYIIGEAKILTTYGGAQTKNIIEAVSIFDCNTNDITKIVILDGVSYFKTNEVQYKRIID